MFSALKREARKHKWVRRFRTLTNYIHATFWVSIAAYVIYKTNFFRQLFENENTNPFFMNLFLVALGLSLTIMGYVTIVRPILG